MGDITKLKKETKTNNRSSRRLAAQNFLRMYQYTAHRDALAHHHDENLNNLPFCITSVSVFLTLVAYGQEKELKNLLEKHPKLLLETGIITDYSGRKIQGTAYQIALGAEDIDMCKMLEPYFAKLENGKAEMKKQFDAQFPDGIINNAPSKYNFEPLVTAITKDKLADNVPNEETQAAIKKFQDDFTPRSEDIITTGKHFNMNHLIEACNIYNSNYGDGCWNWKQSSLFWRQALGHIHRLVPACYAQAFCTDFYRLVVENKPLERKLDLNGGFVYFPLDRDSSFKLGLHYAVSFQWGCPRTLAENTWGWKWPDKNMINYLRQKQEGLENLKLTCNQQTGPSKLKANKK